MGQDKITLSVVIPVYNEEHTLQTCVDRVLAIADKNLCLELILVDDASTDKSLEIAAQIESQSNCVHVLRHSVNRGKGAALRTGFKAATGDYVAVQDADLEYDPQDLRRIMTVFKEQRADAVFGSRFLTSDAHRVLYFWHYIGNSILTFLSNLFTDLNLTDMETCYKVFKREVLQEVEIKENRFGFEPEIVAKIAHRKLRIFEIGISYDGRTFDEGKKIGVKDGFRALYCILKYNFFSAPLPTKFLFCLSVFSFAAVLVALFKIIY